MTSVSVMEHGGPIGIFKGQPDQTQGAAANKYCSLPKSHEHTADSYPGDDGRDANRPEATFEALLFQLFFVFLPMLTYPSKRHCKSCIFRLYNFSNAKLYFYTKVTYRKNLFIYFSSFHTWKSVFQKKNLDPKLLLTENECKTNTTPPRVILSLLLEERRKEEGMVERRGPCVKIKYRGRQRTLFINRDGEWWRCLPCQILTVSMHRAHRAQDIMTVLGA